MIKKFDFNKIKISIASSKNIRSWSNGEVKKPTTINYKSLEPEKSGLFCTKIFGPIKDLQCNCGKYVGKKNYNINCNICNNEILSSKSRRYRMGHIELASPICHIWFLKSSPSYISILLNNSVSNIEKVVYFENYIVIDPGMTLLKIGQTINEMEYLMLYRKFGNEFIVGKGAESIKAILKNINIEEEYKILNNKIKTIKSKYKYIKIKNKIKLLNILLKSKIKPKWMVLSVLPVMPADLRPLVRLDSGSFASSDLNNLYRRIINRNNRLKKIFKSLSSEIIINNEKRMLQESVDALFDNKKKIYPILGSNKNPLKSLSDMIRGKQGRFRQNLLGKRVDYSARTVITVGPKLKLYQCGIPLKIALELFKPFIYSKLKFIGFNFNLKLINKLIKEENKYIIKVLNNILSNKFILLNRAPTLHRLGIQAFKPILIDGKSIQLNPLVCAGYNADFDGDQMAIHLPLNNRSQLEACNLMLSYNNLISPSSGIPIVTPSQDMVLGIYYLSKEKKNVIGENLNFWNINEVIYMYNLNLIDLHAKIFVKIEEYIKKKKKFIKKIKNVITTVGRIILWNIIPKGLSFNLINKILDKKNILKLVKKSYYILGSKKTNNLINDLMYIGFDYATKSGISICIDDIVIPKERKNIIKKSKFQIKKIKEDFKNGLISFNEKYSKTIETWSLASEFITKEMIKNLSHYNMKKKLEYFNNIFTMIDSGARGSLLQIHQLGGIRGLMSRPDSSIIEKPITSNFKEGLNVLQYFISTHGARKGLSDTALKTANSGYLTRRLVNSSQDLIINKTNCKSKNGIKFYILDKKLKIKTYDKVLGRFTLKNIYKNKNKKKLLIKKNTLLNINLCNILIKNLIYYVRIRSIITCKSKRGICVLCYGIDLAKGILVSKGEAIGIIAAQSIGEPGTQLTMRTFHIGGTASNIILNNFIKSKNKGILKLINIKIVLNSNKKNIVVSRNSKLKIIDKFNLTREFYKIPYGSVIYKKNNDKVNINEILVSWNQHANPIISEYNGNVKFFNIINKETVSITKSKFNKISYIKVLSSSEKIGINKKIFPYLKIINKNGKSILINKTKISVKYYLPEGSIINLKNGNKVKIGDVLAKVPLEYNKSKDITGGLPKVSDIFEVVKPKNPAILSEINGIVKFYKEDKNSLFIKIKSKKNNNKIKIPIHRRLNVFNGELIKKGDVISDGQLYLCDILRLKGIEFLSKYIIKEIQNVYLPQGVMINSKHIEVIIHQMIQKVLIKNPGDSNFIKGEEISYFNLKKINRNLKNKNKKTISYLRILLGISKVSLTSESFISSASFQETSSVLIRSSIESKVDKLRGMRENVISGRLIPIGTGYNKTSKKNN